MLLQGKLELHGVDAEALARATLEHELSRHELRLPRHEHDDLITYGIEVVWELSGRYAPAHGISLSTYATRTLRLRFVDYQRKRLGRTRWQFSHGAHERPRRPVPLSLDAPDPDTGRDVAEALTDVAGDPADPGGAGLGGLFAAGVGEQDRDCGLVRAAAAEHARRGTAGARER